MLYSSIIMNKKAIQQFLKPDKLKIKLIISTCIYSSLALHLNADLLGVKTGGLLLDLLMPFMVFLVVLDNLFIITPAQPWLYLLQSVFVVLSPLIVYTIFCTLGEIYKRKRGLQKFFELNWLNALLSVLICVVLTLFLFKPECSGAGIIDGCRYYYFPFYEYFRTDVIIPPPLNLLTINFILGCIIVYPFAGLLGLLIMRIKTLKNLIIRKPGFLKPEWNKILVLIILLFFWSLVAERCLSLRYAVGFSPSSFLLLVVVCTLAWYLISCLVILSYDRVIGGKNKTAKPSAS